MRVEATVRGTHAQLAELIGHEHASLALAQRCSAVPVPTPLFSALLNYKHSPGMIQPPSADAKRAWEGIESSRGKIAPIIRLRSRSAIMVKHSCLLRRRQRQLGRSGYANLCARR